MTQEQFDNHPPMISAKDLRIGNWYKWYAEGKYYEYQVKDIDFCNGNMPNFQPIPLTEEWLDNKIECTKIENKGYPSYNVNGLLINFIDGVWIEYVSRIEIKGIHHLQNIVYFRTNQELTIR